MSKKHRIQCLYCNKQFRSKKKLETICGDCKKKSMVK